MSDHSESIQFVELLRIRNLTCGVELGVEIYKATALAALLSITHSVPLHAALIVIHNSPRMLGINTNMHRACSGLTAQVFVGGSRFPVDGFVLAGVRFVGAVMLATEAAEDFSQGSFHRRCCDQASAVGHGDRRSVVSIGGVVAVSNQGVGHIVDHVVGIGNDLFQRLLDGAFTMDTYPLTPALAAFEIAVAAWAASVSVT